MSKFEISKARLAEIIKEEYASLQELEDPRSPNKMSWEHEGSADDFRRQVMNLVIQLAPNTLEPSKAAAVEEGVRDLLNALDIGIDPRSQYTERLTPDQLEIDEELLGKQKKENLEEAHCGTGHGTRDDKQDQDDDGDKDFADVQIARMTASGMDKEDAIKKTSRKKYNKKPSKKAKKVNKESIDAIRELIKQELQR